MAIVDLFDKQIIVARLKDIDSTKRSFTTTATVDMAVQEMSKKSVEQVENIQGRAWIAYCDILEDIQEGDRLTDKYGTEYKVCEVTRKDYGINQHLQIILQEHKE